MPHRRLGKIIVATEDRAARRARRGAGGGARQRRRRPRRRSTRPTSRGWSRRCAGVAGLLSPSTGIIDSHGLMLSYQGEAEDHGAMLALQRPADAARPRLPGGGFEIEVETRRRDRRGSDAGCSSTPPGSSPARSRRRSRGWRRPGRREVFYCKGNYFAAAGRVPFSRLIYPVPERDGLGVHLTLDLAGAARFGPDTEWIEGIDYGLDAARGDGFYAAIRRYWPGLPDGALSPDLHRHPPEARAGGRRLHRLHHRGAGGARPRRAGQPLRHREPGPDRLARHRRGGDGPGRAARGGLTAGRIALLRPPRRQRITLIR